MSLFPGGNLSLDYFPGVLGDLIVWEETALYYSPNGGLCYDHQHADV